MFDFDQNVISESQVVFDVSDSQEQEQLVSQEIDQGLMVNQNSSSKFYSAATLSEIKEVMPFSLYSKKTMH